MQPQLAGVAVSFGLATPTRLQHKAFDLLGVSLILQSCIGPWLKPEIPTARGFTWNLPRVRGKFGLISLLIIAKKSFACISTRHGISTFCHFTKFFYHIVSQQCLCKISTVNDSSFESGIVSESALKDSIS